MRTVAEDTKLPVAEARAGDADAWNILFRRYQLPLYTYIMDLLRDEQTALDLVQETFLRAVRHIRGLRSEARFGSWLFGIAHQLVVQHWRRQGRSPFQEDGIPLDHPGLDSDPGFELVRQEDAAAVVAAIDLLPEAQRAVILLHFIEDFSLAEIAEVTCVSIGTVKSRLHYAKRALRVRLCDLALKTSPPSHENHS
jgi:RNA polymerase sigma-70 factor (ECF subfamily)